MESKLVIFFFAFLLEGRRCAERGVKRQVMRFSIGGTRLDISAAFFLSLGSGSPPSDIPNHLVKRGVQFAGDERLTGLGLLAALPPVGVELFKNIFGGNRDFAFL